MTAVVTIGTCKLRPMEQQDLGQVLAWRNADRIRLNMYHSEIISWEQHVSWFARIQDSETMKALVFEREGRPLGVVNLAITDVRDQRVTWGFYVGAADAPRGTGTLLGQLGLCYAFEHLGARKVTGEVLAFNEVSRRFHEKLGFEQEGLLRRHRYHAGEFVDVYVYACFQDTWKMEGGEL